MQSVSFLLLLVVAYPAVVVDAFTTSIVKTGSTTTFTPTISTTTAGRGSSRLFLSSDANDDEKIPPESSDEDNDNDDDISSSPENPEDFFVESAVVATAEEEEEEASSSPPPTLSSSLTTLLRLAAGTDRGQAATTTDRDLAALAISNIESFNPNETPTTTTTTSSSDNIIEGTWELLYSDTQLFRSSPFFMAGRAVCKDGNEAKLYDWFCDMHRAALAISNIGKVRQIISPTRMVSEFEVKVGSVPFVNQYLPRKFIYSGGWPVTIDGTIVSSADITPTPSGTAWEILMDTVEIKGSNLPILRQFLDKGLVKLQSRKLGDFLERTVSSYTNPRPVFETTYLDNEIRISRDQDGKVFVYGKVSDEMEPTDYTNVMTDLGVTKLLEGFNDAVTKFYL